MDHSLQSSQVQAFGGYIRRKEVPGRVRALGRIAPEPLQHRAAGRAQRADARGGSAAPRRAEGGEAIAQVAHGGTTSGEHERRDAVGKQGTQGGGAIVVAEVRRFRLATDRPEPGEVGDGQHAASRTGYQLPEHELGIIGAGKAADVATTDSAASAGRVHRLEQEALIRCGRLGECRRARGRGTPEHATEQCRRWAIG